MGTTVKPLACLRVIVLGNVKQVFTARQVVLPVVPLTKKAPLIVVPRWVIKDVTVEERQVDRLSPTLPIITARPVVLCPGLLPRINIPILWWISTANHGM